LRRAVYAITLNRVIDWDQGKVIEITNWVGGSKKRYVHQKGTRQVDEQRRGDLSTFSMTDSSLQWHLA